jgi:predicted kinase
MEVEMALTLEGIPCDSTLALRALEEPVGEMIGVDPRSSCAVRFWLPFLGPPRNSISASVGSGPAADRTMGGTRSMKLALGMMAVVPKPDRLDAPRLVLMCGLPCSGKTTLANALAAETGALTLSPDAWMVQLEVDLWDEPFRGRLERTMWELAQQLLARGVSVILDYGYWTRAERDEIRLRSRELRVSVELRYLDVRLDELARRVEARNSTSEWQETAPITRDHLERWFAMLEEPDQVELALFDEPIVPAG